MYLNKERIENAAKGIFDIGFVPNDIYAIKEMENNNGRLQPETVLLVRSAEDDNKYLVCIGAKYGRYLLDVGEIPATELLDKIEQGLSDEDIMNEIIRETVEYDLVFGVEMCDRQEFLESISLTTAILYNQSDLCSVRDWYMTTYPDDELGSEIADKSFKDFMKIFKTTTPKESYPLMANDSVIRERIFHELANIYNIAYKDVYAQWGAEPQKEIFITEGLYGVYEAYTVGDKFESVIFPITENNKSCILHDGEDSTTLQGSLNFVVCTSLEETLFKVSVPLENIDILQLSDNDKNRLVELSDILKDRDNAMRVNEEYTAFLSPKDVVIDTIKEIKPIIVAFDDMQGAAYLCVNDEIIRVEKMNGTYAFYDTRYNDVQLSNSAFINIVSTVEKAFYEEFRAMQDKDSLANQIEDASAQKENINPKTPNLPAWEEIR